MNRVDVIVPCYNYGRFLRECVESVLSQPVDVHVLIIDDASTDDTPEVAATLADEDARVEIRRHAVNRGHIATYNEGLEWVSADYTLLISADDLLTHGALLRACEFMDTHADVGFVYGRHIRWQTGEPRSVHDPSSEELRSLVIPSLAWIQTVCEKGTSIASPEAVVRTELQKKLGGYRPELPQWADVEMWLRFAAHAPVGYMNVFQAYYRIHATNMHSQGHPMNKHYLGLRDLEQQREAFRLLFDSHGHRLQDAGHLRYLALCRISQQAVSAAYSAFDRGDLDYCKNCLDFAISTSPAISTSKPYSRLRFKLAVGPKLWSLIRPLWRRMRSPHVSADAT